MISVIVIGKNEGERLAACLRSIQTALNVLAHEVVYVDSCSTDQSLQTAKALGARCFLLAERKTTAVWGALRREGSARRISAVLDGDMQLQPDFAEKALMAIAAKGYDGVCGIREDVYLRGGEVVGRNDNYFGCTQERLAPEFGGALIDYPRRAGRLRRLGDGHHRLRGGRAVRAAQGDRLPHRGNPRSDDPAHGRGARQPQPAFHRLSARRLVKGRRWPAR